MRKYLVEAMAIGLALGAQLVEAAGPRPDVAELLRQLDGKQTWLRIDVIRVQYPLRGLDATHIYPDGHVRYQLRLGLRNTESTSADEFTKDVQRSLQQSDQSGQVRVVGKGSHATIVKTQPEKEEIELEFRDSGGSKHKIRLRFKDSDYRYSADDLKRLLAVAFADTEAEAKADRPTASIRLGMSPDDVIAAKGPPKTRVDLGSKIILTYDDLKLVFTDGKLTDVQ